MRETGHDPGTAVRLEMPLSDPRGFVDLYRRESEMILTFCSRRVLDAEAAVDLTAETFAQAFGSRGGFRGSSEVEARAWLLTIARRQIARYLRRGVMDRSAVVRLGIEIPRLEAAEAEESRPGRPRGAASGGRARARAAG